MTTTVKIDAHAGWPVEVTVIDKWDGRTDENKEIVPPHTTKDFYVTQTRELHVREMSRED